MNVNQVAFATITVSALATGGCAFAAATAASKAAAVAYGILGIVSGSINLTSISAWMIASNDESAETYFSRIGNHASKAIPAAFSFISQTLLQALIQGVAKGIRDLVSDTISGRNRPQHA